MSQSNTFDASTLKLDDGDLIQQVGLTLFTERQSEIIQLQKNFKFSNC